MSPFARHTLTWLYGLPVMRSHRGFHVRVPEDAMVKKGGGVVADDCRHRVATRGRPISRERQLRMLQYGGKISHPRYTVWCRP